MFSQTHRLMSIWKSKYPEENINENYMTNELDRTFGTTVGFGGTFITANNIHGWINSVGGHNVAYTAKRMRNCTHIPHACYYNSLDAIKKNYDKGYQLAFGIRVERIAKMPGWRLGLENDSKVQPRYNHLLHAFLIKDGVVYDPTLGSARESENYVFLYEIVSKSVWSKFYHKSNDSNYDAREFGEYITKRLTSYSKRILPPQKSRSRRSL